MMSEDFAAFDEAVVRYLDGCLEGADFEALQDRLRQSSPARRRFLDLCRQAHECSEVADARGLPEAASVLAFEPDDSAHGGEPSHQPAVWRRFGRQAIAAAAAMLVFGAGVALIRQTPEDNVALAVEAADPAMGEVLPHESSRATRPVSLLEPRPGGFALSSQVQPVVWDEIEPDVALRYETYAGWLDGIGLLVVHQPTASVDPEDIQL